MLKLLCVAALMTSSSGVLFAQSLSKKCEPASFVRSDDSARESISDDFGDYFEFDGVRYGTSQNGEVYVGVDSENVMVESVHFRDHRGKQINLRSEDLAISRAVAYRSKSDRLVVCVLSPFSGIGSSGSFQARVGLIAVRKPDGRSVLRVEGAIVRLRK